MLYLFLSLIVVVGILLLYFSYKTKTDLKIEELTENLSKVSEEKNELEVRYNKVMSDLKKQEELKRSKDLDEMQLLFTKVNMLDDKITFSNASFKSKLDLITSLLENNNAKVESTLETPIVDEEEKTADEFREFEKNKNSQLEMINEKPASDIALDNNIEDKNANIEQVNEAIDETNNINENINFVEKNANNNPLKTDLSSEFQDTDKIDKIDNTIQANIEENNNISESDNIIDSENSTNVLLDNTANDQYNLQETQNDTERINDITDTFEDIKENNSDVDNLVPQLNSNSESNISVDEEKDVKLNNVDLSLDGNLQESNNFNIDDEIVNGNYGENKNDLNNTKNDDIFNIDYNGLNNTNEEGSETDAETLEPIDSFDNPTLIGDNETEENNKLFTANTKDIDDFVNIDEDEKFLDDETKNEKLLENDMQDEKLIGSDVNTPDSEDFDINSLHLPNSDTETLDLDMDQYKNHDEQSKLNNDINGNNTSNINESQLDDFDFDNMGLEEPSDDLEAPKEVILDGEALDDKIIQDNTVDATHGQPLVEPVFDEEDENEPKFDNSPSFDIDILDNNVDINNQTNENIETNENNVLEEDVLKTQNDINSDDELNMALRELGNTNDNYGENKSDIFNKDNDSDINIEGISDIAEIVKSQNQEEKHNKDIKENLEPTMDGDIDLNSQTYQEEEDFLNSPISNDNLNASVSENNDGFDIKESLDKLRAQLNDKNENGEN